MTSSPHSPHFKLLIFVIGLCLIPGILELIGINFGTEVYLWVQDSAPVSSPQEWIDQMHYTLAGSFVHTLLEWSAFCTGLFTAILAFVHFIFNRDPVTPIIGIVLFYAGCMDAFHTLASDRLIEGVADSSHLIPFTWTICRLFSGMILMAGTSIFLVFKKLKFQGNLAFIFSISLILGMFAYLIILGCVNSNNLPQTMFPDAWIARPWDILPLLLFIVLGFFIFPPFYRQYPGIFSYTLIISLIPQIFTQVHMALGSRELFDSDFNVAHFLKIVAYFIPFCGLCFSYIQMHQEKILMVNQLEKIKENLVTKSEELSQTVYQLKNTQSQLVHTEKMSSLGQLVGGIAHEINNPISFIYGNINHTEIYLQELVNLLKLYQAEYPNSSVLIQDKIEEIELDFIIEDSQKILISMKEGTQRIRDIVQSLRNFSRLQEAEMKEVNLHEGIDSTLLVLQSRLQGESLEKPIIVIKDYADIPPVMCYAADLNQVFLNILNNAIDALASKRVENTDFPLNPEAVSDISAPTIRICTAFIPPKEVTVTIMDNGPGISEELQPKIFDPFFTTKPVGAGTGLGLSISYQIIVEKHQGHLSCLSVPGEGTEFLISIPLREI